MSIKQGNNYIAAGGSGGSVSIDNLSITENSSQEIQTVGVINQNATTTAIKTWTGTRSQYDAIASKDANTLYNITDDTDVSLTILEALYPVGSIYITTNATCPLSTLIAGSTWVQETSRILVDKGDSGTEWWELYNDGWCRQGGQIAGINNSYTTVNLSKSFADTNYTITTSFQSSSASYPNTTIIGYYSKQQSDFKLGSRYVANYETSTAISWEACGYTSMTTSHKQFRRTA
jgi:hypothetical protein